MCFFLTLFCLTVYHFAIICGTTDKDRGPEWAIFHTVSVSRVSDLTLLECLESDKPITQWISHWQEEDRSQTWSCQKQTTGLWLFSTTGLWSLLRVRVTSLYCVFSVCAIFRNSIQPPVDLNVAGVCRSLPILVHFVSKKTYYNMLFLKASVIYCFLVIFVSLFYIVFISLCYLWFACCFM